MTTQEFISLLFCVVETTHKAHWQTNCHSTHLALDDIYKGIPELQDRFVESYQGKYGILYNIPKTEEPEGQDMVDYITKVCKSIEDDYYESIKEGFLKQITDDILELLYSNLYKLRELNDGLQVS